MERRIEERVDDDLRVITHEGDLEVIRDLRPEPTEAPPAPVDVPSSPVGHDGATGKRYRLLVAGHVASDALCLNLALFSTQILDEAVLAPTASRFLGLFTVAGTLLWLAIFHLFGLYASRNLSITEEVRRVVGAVAVGAAVFFIAGAESLPQGIQERLGLAFVLVLTFEIGTRMAWRWYVRGLRSRGLLAQRTLLIGSSHEARSVASSIGDDDRTGFFPIGRVAHEPGHEASGAPPFLGSLADLPTVVRERSVEALVVTTASLTSEDLNALLQLCRREELTLRLVARVPHLLTNRLSLQSVGSLMTVAVRPAVLTGTQAALKRAFDVGAGSLALVLSLPIQLVVGILVGLTSPGPVFFRQQRVTKGNRVFTVYKFRTMDRDADRLMDDMQVDRSQPFFKDQSAPVTRVGRWLRVLSLDELPQLWNIVRGDMSIVGPRPLTSLQVEANPELLGPRHEVRAGLTGWWQVNGRSEVGANEAIKQDLFYIENWSLMLDLYVIMRTVGVVLARKGAR
jgi:exopolysaccharide biosynthesis polyprenyl glycosylphosphotransferase